MKLNLNGQKNLKADLYGQCMGSEPAQHYDEYG